MSLSLEAVVERPEVILRLDQRRSLWLDALDMTEASRILTRSEFELLAKHARGTKEDESTIAKDLPRSRIGGGSSSDELSEADQQVLRQILRVYAVLDPQVGYCQGMNFVATLCLHVLPGGAGYDAFCLFAAMLLPEGLGLRTLYTDGFHTAMAVVHAVEQITAERDAELAAHLGACGTGLTGSILPWAITLFSAALPLGPTFCCWDRLVLGLRLGPTAPRARTVLAVLCRAVLDSSRAALLGSSDLQTHTFHRLVGDASSTRSFTLAAGRMLRTPIDIEDILRHTAEFDATDSAGAAEDGATEAIERRAEDVHSLVKRARSAAALEEARAAEERVYGSSTLQQLEAGMATGDEEVLREALAALAQADRDAGRRLSGGPSPGAGTEPEPEPEPEPQPEREPEPLLDLDGFFGAGGGGGGGGGAAAAVAGEEDAWVLLTAADGASPHKPAAQAAETAATDILENFFGSGGGWELIAAGSPRAAEAEEETLLASVGEGMSGADASPAVADGGGALAGSIDDFFGTSSANSDGAVLVEAAADSKKAQQDEENALLSFLDS